MHWPVLWDFREALLDGLRFTLMLSAAAIAGSFVLGTALGCIGSLPGFLARRVVGLYVEVMRNLPVVVKLFLLYFLIGLDAIPAGLIALISHQAAYIADVVAAGFRTVPREQGEAAWSQGLTRLQAFRAVLLPQVFRSIMPPLTSQFIEVVKNSAVVMLIGVQELTFKTQHIEHQTLRGFEAATAVTLAYLAIALVIAGGMTAIQRRLARG